MKKQNPQNNQYINLNQILNLKSNIKKQSQPLLLFFMFLSGAHLILSEQSIASVGSVSAATGNAGVAAVEAGESSMMNPATLGYIKGYYFGTTYGTQIIPMFEGKKFSVSLTDALKDTVVPTSINYEQVKWTANSADSDSALGGGSNNSQAAGFQGLNEWNSKLVQLAFGNQINSYFSFGLGINFQNDNIQDVNYNQTNLSLGGMLAVNKNLGFAVVFQNLFSADKKIPEMARLPQRTILGGTFHYKKLVRFKLDASSDHANAWNKPVIMGGVENYLNKWMIFRVGALRDNELAAYAWSAGVGFVLPKFAIQYAYQNSTENSQLQRHSVDLAVPVW